MNNLKFKMKKLLSIGFIFLTVASYSCKDKGTNAPKEESPYPFKGVVHKKNCYYKIDVLEGIEQVKAKSDIPAVYSMKYICVRHIAAAEGDTIYFDCKPLNYRFYIDCQQLDDFDARMSVALVGVRRDQLDH
jgi:hypothetical protein